MTAPEALVAVKSRLGIPTGTTTFDTQINEFVASAVRRLYPRVKMEVASQEVTSYSIDNLGETQIDLSTLTTPIKSARKVEINDGFSWSPVSDTYHHGKYLRLRGLSSSSQPLRIYGLTPFPTIASVYDEILQAVIWLAMSEFYDFLAGTGKSYNIYMQVSGARAVDNMADQSAYYDTKANNFIDEQARSYGG